MDLVYEALDSINMAGKTTFGIDTELEAISEGVIGKINYLGLKKLERAKTHLNNCIRLALTLAPRPVENLPWYI